MWKKKQKQPLVWIRFNVRCLVFIMFIRDKRIYISIDESNSERVENERLQRFSERNGRRSY